jgi:MoaA/NifB/PqqE/SkfB family radical SAM enzyme
MDTDLALRIIDQLADAGVRSVTWTGGGEPTLHPDFNRIVEYGADRLASGIYTHGGHLDPERAALLKAKFSWVYVSLDAANANDYARDKGVQVGRFQKAKDGIERLAQAEGPATVGVGFLVTETNWQNARKAAELVKGLGADYIQFRPTVHYKPNSPGEVAEDTSWLDEAMPFLVQIKAAFPEFVEVDMDRFHAYRNWDGHPYPQCFWAGIQTVITPNGKVWVCANKREHQGAELGDLSVESFAAVWGRRKIPAVDHDCRVMCRGHVPNVALKEMLAPRVHPEFV